MQPGDGRERGPNPKGVEYDLGMEGKGAPTPKG